MEMMGVKKHYASLSEAMRAGIPLRRQAFGGLFIEGGSCALGAAMEASLEHPDCSDYVFDVFAKLYSGTLEAITSCPVPECKFVEYSSELGIGFTVTHLNDDHKWMREKIADWLESEEEKLGFVLLSEEAPELSLDPSTCQQRAGGLT